MEIGARKVVANLFYYTMAAMLVGFGVLFMILINTKTLATYQAIVYNVWAGLLILVVIADVLATMMNRYKLIVGLLVYGLAFLSILVGFIVFAGLSTNGVVLAANLDLFNTLVIFSIGLSAALCALYALGLRVDKINAVEE